MEQSCVLATQQDIQNRMQQIASAREQYIKYKKGIIVSSQKILELSAKNDHISSDNPSCAFIGFININTSRIYSCPIEQLSEQELKQINLSRGN